MFGRSMLNDLITHSNPEFLPKVVLIRFMIIRSLEPYHPLTMNLRQKRFIHRMLKMLVKRFGITKKKGPIQVPMVTIKMWGSLDCNLEL